MLSQIIYVELNLASDFDTSALGATARSYHRQDGADAAARFE